MRKTVDERRGNADRMRANFALEGLLADAQDMDIQRHYILGELTLNDLLTHNEGARQGDHTAASAA